MTQGSYKQFCPLAMACEILCSRWTLVLLRELTLGTTRFNELRRGVPRMSPALMSKRLKELEKAGLVTRKPVKGEPGLYEYGLTAAGHDLKPVIDTIGIWGHRWIETEASLKNLDVDLLMWSMRRNIDPKPMPERRCVIQIIYPDLPPARRNWWLIVEPQSGADLCSLDPGFDVDLYLSTDLKTMTEVYMGYTDMAKAIGCGRLTVTGSRDLQASIGRWLGVSSLAKLDRMVA